MTDFRTINAPDLEERGYKVICGLNETFAQKLIDQSHEPHILKTTPNDAGKRFRTLESTFEWFHDSERFVYLLIRGDELCGLSWVSRKHLADNLPEYTFAIRLYESALGQRVSEPFSRAVNADARAQGIDGMWLETDTDNVAARHLYEKLGYVLHRETETRVVMVLYQ